MKNHLASLVEWLSTAAAVVFAVWILVSTINIARAGWVAVPIGDDWDRWITYLNEPRLGWYFMRHVDHRLVLPKILFEADRILFASRGWFVLVCSFCLQAITVLMFRRLSSQVVRQSAMDRVILTAAIVACLFSGQQWVNFVWPFQVQFAMVFCAATAAFLSLCKASQEQGRALGRRHLVWVAATIAFATMATYSMANGTVLWPVLLAAAFWLRLPRRSLAALAAGAILLGGSFFYHWQPSTPTHVLSLSERLPRMAAFIVIHMGDPVFPLVQRFTGAPNVLLTTAGLAGSLIALTLVAGFAFMWMCRERFVEARATFVFLAAFLAITSLSMAYGRADHDLLDAFSPRYFTPSYLLWVCLLVALWPSLHRFPRAPIYAAIAAALFLGIALHQRQVADDVRSRVPPTITGELAMVNNVVDPATWPLLYHTPRIQMDAINFLRNQRLTVYTEEWTHWVGVELNRRFFVDRNPDACQGEFQAAEYVKSPLRPGWRVEGWAWDVKAGHAPRYIVLADDSGHVAGVGLSGFPQPPTLSFLAPQYLGSPWVAYVDGMRRPVTAYAVEQDYRSLCAIGKRQLPAPVSEVQFQELGDLLPDSVPEMSGWSPDGYYQKQGGPGALPVPGRVFGSFPDSITGTFRIGPFQLDGKTEIGIPVVTGPDSHKLKLVLRDAGSKEVLASLDPLPMRQTWWVWHPTLPAGREMALEIFAEDTGSAWGQWLAVGWPHRLR